MLHTVTSITETDLSPQTLVLGQHYLMVCLFRKQQSEHLLSAHCSLLDERWLQWACDAAAIAEKVTRPARYEYSTVCCQVRSEHQSAVAVQCGHCVKIPNTILFLLFGRNCIIFSPHRWSLFCFISFRIFCGPTDNLYCSFAAHFHRSQFHFHKFFFSLQFSFTHSFDCFVCS